MRGQYKEHPDSLNTDRVPPAIHWCPHHLAVALLIEDYLSPGRVQRSVDRMKDYLITRLPA
jgi:hypothetical protein